MYGKIKVSNREGTCDMYSTTRYYYPNGIEGESMQCTFKDFDDIDKAIKYCHRYAKGLRFAGVKVEDEKGNAIFEITSDFEPFDYRQEGVI